MEVKIINKSNNPLPTYATEGSAGIDLKASFTQLDNDFKGNNFERIIDNNLNKNYILLHPNGRILIPTDLYMEIPKGYEFQVRSRSGIALKEGLIILNGIGTIDEDYRGNIGLILFNASNCTVKIKSGDKLGQGVLCKYEKIEFKEVTQLSDTDRGKNGYGSTGK
jgi:dUTP pyrophosphatase